MDSRGFCEVENFALAYDNRINEYMKIYNMKDELMILIMHWG